MQNYVDKMLRLAGHEKTQNKNIKDVQKCGS